MKALVDSYFLMSLDWKTEQSLFKRYSASSGSQPLSPAHMWRGGLLGRRGAIGEPPRWSELTKFVLVQIA